MVYGEIALRHQASTKPKKHKFMKYFLLFISFAFLGIATKAQEFDQPFGQTKYLVENADLDSCGENCIWSLKDAELQKLPKTLLTKKSSNYAII